MLFALVSQSKYTLNFWLLGWECKLSILMHLHLHSISPFVYAYFFCYFASCLVELFLFFHWLGSVQAWDWADDGTTLMFYTNWITLEAAEIEIFWMDILPLIVLLLVPQHFESDRSLRFSLCSQIIKPVNTSVLFGIEKLIQDWTRARSQLTMALKDVYMGKGPSSVPK